jgi:hypothetical protein
MAVIPKNLEKPVFYGVAILGGLFVFKILTSSVKDATAGVVGGIIEGAFDATAGVLQGAYNALPEPVKPSSPNNVVYQGVNKVGEVFTGDAQFDLGVWIYDKTH